MSEPGLVVGDDGIPRCPWAGPSPDYVAYHDLEWGRPVADDHRLFEKLCLEGFQSGLSWLTILRKREHFRRAFAGFDPVVVAGFGPDDVERLLGDAGIVRHRGKITSTVNNAARALEVVRLAKDLKRRGWTFVGPTTVYAFMQAMGLVNDHVEGCHVRGEVLADRAGFTPPSPRSWRRR